MTEGSKINNNALKPDWFQVILKWFGWGCLGIFIVFLILIIISSLLGARRASPYSLMKGTLRSIGSSQLDYRRFNENNEYGTFDDLQAENYIAEGYNLGNMNEYYTMTWTVSHRSTIGGGDINVGEINSFTVVAYPLDARLGGLYTFGINEDQVVRVYNPNNGNQYNDPDDPMVSTWDPIL